MQISMLAGCYTNVRSTISTSWIERSLALAAKLASTSVQDCLFERALVLKAEDNHGVDWFSTRHDPYDWAT